MAGYYTIGTKKGKLYHIGVCGNPRDMERKVVSKMKKGDYSDHIFLSHIQQFINGVGPEDIYSGFEEVEKESELNRVVNAKRSGMDKMGYINVLDVRDPENEYPPHFARVLKKTADLLEHGVISVEDFEKIIDEI